MPPLYHIRRLLHGQNDGAILHPNKTSQRIFIALHLQNDLPPSERKRI
jgi:hypothetical protein